MSGGVAGHSSFARPAGGASQTGSAVTSEVWLGKTPPTIVGTVSVSSIVQVAAAASEPPV